MLLGQSWGDYLSPRLARCSAIVRPKPRCDMLTTSWTRSRSTASERARPFRQWRKQVHLTKRGLGTVVTKQRSRFPSGPRNGLRNPPQGDGFGCSGGSRRSPSQLVAIAPAPASVRLARDQVLQITQAARSALIGGSTRRTRPDARRACLALASIAAKPDVLVVACKSKDDRFPRAGHPFILRNDVFGPYDASSSSSWRLTNFPNGTWLARHHASASK